MIIDINDLVKPKLQVMDAVMGMPGPVSSFAGTPLPDTAWTQKADT